ERLPLSRGHVVGRPACERGKYDEKTVLKLADQPQGAATGGRLHKRLIFRGPRVGDHSGERKIRRQFERLNINPLDFRTETVLNEIQIPFVIVTVVLVAPTEAGWRI